MTQDFTAGSVPDIFDSILKEMEIKAHMSDLEPNLPAFQKRLKMIWTADGIDKAPLLQNLLSIVLQMNYRGHSVLPLCHIWLEDRDCSESLRSRVSEWSEQLYINEKEVRAVLKTWTYYLMPEHAGDFCWEILFQSQESRNGNRRFTFGGTVLTARS
jgi:hypothetical protein